MRGWNRLAQLKHLELFTSSDLSAETLAEMVIGSTFLIILLPLSIFHSKYLYSWYQAHAQHFEMLSPPPFLIPGSSY